MAEAIAHKKFRLSLVNAAEDVPRLIRAYGRACDGEFALVLRPPEERGVLVLVTKKDGARFWRSAEGADAPAVPATAVSAKEGVALVKTEQKAVPKPGPITLRGQWSGWMHCDAGAPRVELVRKLAACGVLRIVSSGAGWTWTVERTEKWFSRAGSDEGSAATLVKAIEAGLARAMGLLGEACSVRDSRRRAALDTTYAAERPVKPAHEGRDPTERMKVKEMAARAPGKPAGSPWTRFDGEPPEADPIDRPTRAIKSAVRKGGFTHDAGAGSFLGRSAVDHATFPAGSLVFRSAVSDGFWMARTVESPPRPAPAPASTTVAASAAEKPKRSTKPKAVPPRRRGQGQGAARGVQRRDRVGDAAEPVAVGAQRREALRRSSACLLHSQGRSAGRMRTSSAASHARARQPRARCHDSSAEAWSLASPASWHASLSFASRWALLVLFAATSGTPCEDPRDRVRR